MFGSKDKDKRIRELESDLRAAVVELNRVRADVREQTFRITCYQQTVDNQNKTIRGQMEESDKLKANIAALDMAIENLQRQNSRQMDQLIVGDATITDLRKQLVERDNQIALQKAFINRVNSVLGVQSERIEDYKRQIADLEQSHSSQKERQRASENVIRNLRAEISGDRLQINDLCKELEWHKQRLQDAEEMPAIQAVFTNDAMLACQLEEANGEIKKLRATITEQDRKIHELRGRVEARNNMLAKQSDVVTKLEQAQEHLGVQIQVRDQRIAYLNGVVAMKERAISAGASALGNKDATIRGCEAVIDNLRKEIESCKNMISAQADGLTCLRTKLSEKEKQIESYRSSNRVAADNIRKLMDEIESGKMTRRGAVENIRLLSDMCDQLKKLLKEKETLLSMQQQTICKREDEIRGLKDSSQFAAISHYEDQIHALKAERDRLTTHSLSITADYTTLKDANGKLLVQLEAAESHIGHLDREAHEFQSVFLRQRAETDKLIKCVNAQARTIADQKSIIATLSTVIETYIRN